LHYEHISWKAVIIWELLAALAAALLITLILLIFVPYTWLWYLLLWTSGAVYVLAAFLYLPLLYLSISYAVGRDALVYRSGVIFPSVKVLYRERIAFVSVYNNPLTPVLRLSSFVASGAGGNLRILFMNTGRAQELAELLAGAKLS
jgi:membrane protein YdbS with pleckstrin-like domain